MCELVHSMEKFLKVAQVCRSMEVAEFTKLYENSYRSVHFGFANQHENYSRYVGNEYSLRYLAASSTKPFGFHLISTQWPGVVRVIGFQWIHYLFLISLKDLILVQNLYHSHETS